MLVYGDAERICDPHDGQAAIAAALAQARRAPAGLSRHGLLVEAFVQAAELVAALIDAEWQARGFDAPSPAAVAGTALLRQLAGAVGTSWESEFTELALAPEAEAALDALALPPSIRLRKAEGFSLYALYPESYWEAARPSRLDANTVVIGIRSVGLPLAAVVAAALGVERFYSLRPTGHPFDRRIEAAPELVAALVSDPEAQFAVVDEGPGLSGSSFAAVAKLLEEAGVDRTRICFFPSHGGSPGSQASPETRQRWTGSRRFVRGFDETVVGPSGARGLRRWVADLLRTAEHPLEDVSGGGWRRFVQGGETLPADARLERRKFLAQTEQGRFLVKFAGLGEEGRRKLRNAEMLCEAGFAPRPKGLVHGMLATEWRDGNPLQSIPASRGAFLQRLGAYLGFRAGNLPPHNTGATAAELAHMAAFNAGQGLGPDAADRLRHQLASLGNPDDGTRRVDTDNRLHRWEWLETAGGAWLKLDALDHSSGHDLIGCQSIAWDVAGAVVEFDLSNSEAAELRAAVAEAAGEPVPPAQLRFMLPCYAAFQLGLWSMAADAAVPEERPRLALERDRYRACLALLIDAPGSGRPSLV